MSEPLAVKWVWCWWCQCETVMCPRCGTTGCSIAEDGGMCPVCPLAAEIQDAAVANGTIPTIPDSEKGEDPFGGAAVSFEELLALFPPSKDEPNANPS